ncbi:hypothetical protein B0J13DRAFT_662562 [Dactylonectria estremocensis]|uniref:CHAT domain-containing protein n=1 Tax=Dactylonectria estremocensis TaxID=1079267 RepID=A0A9P9I6S4_9HYPO|nr:hypothetical protein B0J13DRAFT_662562 [Dactylonectria estremocensis]
MPISTKMPGDKKAPKDLPGAIAETEAILNSARSQIHTTVLTHPNPSNSGIILQKGTGPGGALEQDRLTVQRVSELRLRHAQIAYLSACSTAENKVARLSDEVIHVCVEVAKGFYSLILQRNQSAINNNEVTSALQEAVMAVRAGDLSMPLNWAQFVHYGA